MLEKKTESLHNKKEKTNSKLETLLQQEDQEGGNLVVMLRSDIELSRNERKKLQVSYQRVLKLLSRTAKAITAIKDLICNKFGLYFDSGLACGDSREC
uniref:Uncharacterized protein n=1 Tax=Sphenodon punctatus TaxID=8508 RepID=A0A8D0HFQ0_SPHPU